MTRFAALRAGVNLIPQRTAQKIESSVCQLVGEMAAPPSLDVLLPSNNRQRQGTSSAKGGFLSEVCLCACAETDKAL